MVSVGRSGDDYCVIVPSEPVGTAYTQIKERHGIMSAHFFPYFELVHTLDILIEQKMLLLKKESGEFFRASAGVHDSTCSVEDVSNPALAVDSTFTVEPVAPASTADTLLVSELASANASATMRAQAAAVAYLACVSASHETITPPPSLESNSGPAHDIASEPDNGSRAPVHFSLAPTLTPSSKSVFQDVSEAEAAPSSAPEGTVEAVPEHETMEAVPEHETVEAVAEHETMEAVAGHDTAEAVTEHNTVEAVAEHETMDAVHEDSSHAAGAPAWDAATDPSCVASPPHCEESGEPSTTGASGPVQGPVSENDLPTMVNANAAAFKEATFSPEETTAAELPGPLDVVAPALESFAFEQPVEPPVEQPDVAAHDVVPPVEQTSAPAADAGSPAPGPLALIGLSKGSLDTAAAGFSKAGREAQMQMLQDVLAVRARLQQLLERSNSASCQLAESSKDTQRATPAASWELWDSWDTLDDNVFDAQLPQVTVLSEAIHSTPSDHIPKRRDVQEDDFGTSSSSSAGAGMRAVEDGKNIEMVHAESSTCNSAVDAPPAELALVPVAPVTFDLGPFEALLPAKPVDLPNNNNNNNNNSNSNNNNINNINNNDLPVDLTGVPVTPPNDPGTSVPRTPPAQSSAATPPIQRLQRNQPQQQYLASAPQKMLLPPATVGSAAPMLVDLTADTQRMLGSSGEVLAKSTCCWEVLGSSGEVLAKSICLGSSGEVDMLAAEQLPGPDGVHGHVLPSSGELTAASEVADMPSAPPHGQARDLDLEQPASDTSPPAVCQ
ncbi:unnamed protein product [Polarella glacialis]|uniref:Uncharacterized protein n=2 Tax=Polarella glacialis TaxID=89957 RepID=A0A813H9D4_POLGL|nr:unnamed protein product [Polarella glacialis]